MVNSHDLCGFLGKSLGTREDDKIVFQHLSSLANTRISLETNARNLCLSFLVYSEQPETNTALNLKSNSPLSASFSFST